MEIDLELALGSAVRYVQDKADAGTKLYFDEIPEDFYVPSMYFPVPATVIRKVTLETYLVTVRFEVWFMASKVWDAQAAAVKLRDSLFWDNCRIPSTDKVGLQNGKIFNVTDVKTDQVGDCTVKVSFGIQHYIAKPVGDKINIFYSSLYGNEGSIYGTWSKATDYLRN